MANSEMKLFNDSDFITLPQGENKGDVMVRPSVSYWSDVWRRIRSDKVAMVSLTVISIIAPDGDFRCRFSVLINMKQRIF